MAADSARSVRPCVESLTRRLVEETRHAGSPWADPDAVFQTSAADLRPRFGDMRSYDDQAR